VEAVTYDTCSSPAETLARARSLLGHRAYNLFGNNCEHFCSYCRTGAPRSTQVEAVRAGGAGTVTAASVGAATEGGVAVAGTSGLGTVAEVTSGLAAVGGSLVAGTVLLAAVPPTAVAAMTAAALRDSPDLPVEERHGRTAARVGARVGAAAGTAASVTAVAVTGSTVGITSVAGVTSGLAAVGSVVGGGMAAGVLVTAFASAVAAGVFVWACYKLFRG